jgi:hypothetical protein
MLTFAGKLNTFNVTADPAKEDAESVTVFV